MKKNVLQFGLAIALLTTLNIACTDPTEEIESTGNWVRRSYFDGSNRSNSSSFTIKGKHYIVGGFTGDEYKNDLWEYDPEKDSWTKKANFPGVARANAAVFVVESTAYYGTGYDGRKRLSDFWAYDPITNSWKQTADFPGSTRYNALAFALGGNGYLGTGFDGSEQKDFYKYDPKTNTWSSFQSFGGSKRQGAFVFTIGNTVYLGGGINNGIYQNDFWALDQSTLTWTEKKRLNDSEIYTMARNEAMAFSIGGNGYVAVGSNGQLIETTWEYNPTSDTWKKKTNFEGTLRTGASVFNANERAFVLLGRNSSSRFDDVWEFKPLEEFNKND